MRMATTADAAGASRFIVNRSLLSLPATSSVIDFFPPGQEVEQTRALMPYSQYLPDRMGSIELSPKGPFVAGSHQQLTLVYTAGTFGIDDTGMLKVSWRTTSDLG